MRLVDAPGMTEQRRPRAREGEEIWETTTSGIVYYTTTDSRGHERVRSAGGQTGTRFRITTVDRELNQDAIVNDADDPFHNGWLRRADVDQNLDERTATDQALTTEELMAVFAKSGNAFQSAVRKLNERNVRRLREMVELVDASQSQQSFLSSHIEENYRQQGSMPSYDELVRDRDLGTS